MLISPRSDGSIDQSAEQFVAAAREALALQTAAHAAGWRFGDEDNWAADLGAGTIVFEFFDGPNLTSVRGCARGTGFANGGSRGRLAFWRRRQLRADLGAGTIVFEFFDGPNLTSVSASIQVIGTYDTLDGTFLWGWDHPSVPAALSGHARMSKAWGEQSGVSTFTTRKLQCTEDEAWSLAAVTAHLANANGVYRGPAGTALVFFTFGEVQVETCSA